MKTITVKFIEMKSAYIRLTLICIVLGIYRLSDAQIVQSGILVGGDAPPIKVGKWIKGKPIKMYEHDYLYVVEFSGVGCGPCRASIPLLSEIAVKYRDWVKMISVYVLENGGNPPKDTVDTAYMKTVERYIDKIKDKVAYDVVVDDPAQTMFTNWLKRSGSVSIPKVFLVNGFGKIEWIGQPYQLEGELKRRLKIEALVSVNQKLCDSTNKQHDNLDIQIAQSGSQNPMLYSKKFKQLLIHDEKLAYEYGWRWLEYELKYVEPVLFYIARDIGNQKVISKAGFDLALALLDRAFELCEAELVRSKILKYQATVYLRMNDPKSAIIKLQHAIAELEPYKEEFRFKQEIGAIKTRLQSISPYLCPANGATP